MNAYASIGKGLATATLALAKAMGAQVELRHRDRTCRTLWAVVGEERVSVVEENGIQTEQRTRQFSIPTQPGFDLATTLVEPIIPGDRIRHNGRDYFVLANGIGKAANDNVYDVQCAQSKRLASGTS